MTYSWDTYAWDRMVMVLFAIVEFVLGIMLVWDIGQIHSHVTNEVVAGANMFTNALDNKSQDLRDVVLTMVGWSLGMAILSLISVIAVSLYYTVGKKLNYHSEQMSSMQPDGMLRMIVKLLIIALGALGVVGVVASLSILSGTSVGVYTMTFTAVDKKKAVLELFVRGVVYGVVILIFKLLEALLGHAWAIGLSKKHVETVKKVTSLRAPGGF